MNTLRYSARLLRKSPGFTMMAALILALGIGVNSAVFTVLKGIVLRPLPGVADADELVVLLAYTKGGQPLSLSYPDYRDFRDRNTVFSSLAASCTTPMAVRAGETPERVWGEMVSGNLFQTLGVKAALGRTLTPADDRTPGAHPVAVVSHGFWQRRLGADPRVIGRSITIGQTPFTIVGVTEPQYRGSIVGLNLHVFVPLAMEREALQPQSLREDRQAQWLVAQGRLKPGVHLEQARQAMAVLGQQLSREYPDENIRQRGSLTPLWQSPFGSQTYLFPIFSVALVICGLALLVACANLANLMLARGAARVRETAIRRALGASRWRLAWQSLSESLLLSALGAGLGILVSLWLSDVIAAVDTKIPFPVFVDTRFDGAVLAFAVAIAAGSAAVFGLAPALSLGDLMAALKENAARGARGARLRRGLVVAQLALSLIMLISAGLVWRSLRGARDIPPGFDPENLLLMAMDVRPLGYQAAAGTAFFDRVLERVRSLPGVESAQLAAIVPVTMLGAPTRSVEIEGHAPRKDEDMNFHFNVVTPGYFRDLRIPLLDGREFSAGDREDTPPVVVVNATLARRYWPGQNPLGRKVRVDGKWREVAGVARDIKYLYLDEAPEPYLYLPLVQSFWPQVTLHIRAAEEGALRAQTVQQELRRLDPNLPVFDVRTMRDNMAFSLLGYSISTSLLGGTGLLGLVLAAIGTFGLVSYSVTQRRREIGVRLALGAQRRDIERLVTGEGARLAALGIVLGLAGSALATRWLSALLYGVSPIDPATFAAAALFLGGVALLASYLPARRASAVDPVQALRCE